MYGATYFAIDYCFREYWGSIPVCTGPRENTPLALILLRGLSPCVRGHLIYRCFVNAIQWVYPRVYGATLPKISFVARRGLSPCVRGHQSISYTQVVSDRVYPVCTGPPAPCLMKSIGVGSIPVCTGPPAKDQKTDQAFAGGSIPVCTGPPS